MFMSFAAPASALPSANSASAVSITGLLPKMSARRPHRRRTAVLDKAYAAPTQMNFSPPLRSWTMVGRDVGMAHISSTLMDRDTRTAEKAIQNASPLGGAALAMSQSVSRVWELASFETRIEPCDMAVVGMNEARFGSLAVYPCAAQSF